MIEHRDHVGAIGADRRGGQSALGLQMAGESVNGGGEPGIQPGEDTVCGPTSTPADGVRAGSGPTFAP